MSSSDMLATISLSSGYLPKKCSRVYAPPLALKFWYSPSTHSSITRRRRPFLSRASSGSQREPQTTLMTFQPAPMNAASSSWMILPLPRTGPSRRCRLQLTTNTRLSSFSRTGSVSAPMLSGSSISPSPRKAQTLRSDTGAQAAILHVALKARLVDGHHRAETHRHRGELPEVRHQPRMRIRRQAVAARFLAEMLELIFAEAAFEEGARVDAGRRVTLHEHHVAGMIRRRGAPEMIEAHFVQRGRRGVSGQVAAVLARHLVRAQHHGQRVPADAGLDAPFHLAVARVRRLLPGGDRVDVGGVRAERQVRARAAGVVDELLEEVMRAFRTLRLEYRVDGFDPLTSLDGIERLRASRFPS